MSKGMHDICACHPKHVTLGLFEVVYNPKKTLAKNLIELLE
jgi:hypothetical protein